MELGARRHVDDVPDAVDRGNELVLGGHRHRGRVPEPRGARHKRNEHHKLTSPDVRGPNIGNFRGVYVEYLSVKPSPTWLRKNEATSLKEAREQQWQEHRHLDINAASHGRASAHRLDVPRPKPL